MVDVMALSNTFHYNQETGMLTRISNGKSSWSKNSNGYLNISFSGGIYQAHHVCWAIATGKWPHGHMDHINGVRDDNRLVNLRIVSPGENAKNKRIGKSNTSGVLGVSFDKERMKWRAYIKANGKQMCLGRFDSIERAKQARKDALLCLGFHENHGRLPTSSGEG